MPGHLQRGGDPAPDEPAGSDHGDASVGAEERARDAEDALGGGTPELEGVVAEGVDVLAGVDVAQQVGQGRRRWRLHDHCPHPGLGRWPGR